MIDTPTNREQDSFDDAREFAHRKSVDILHAAFTLDPNFSTCVHHDFAYEWVGKKAGQG
jgi:hypothetical protein